MTWCIHWFYEGLVCLFCEFLVEQDYVSTLNISLRQDPPHKPMIEIVKQNTAKVKYLYTHSELFFLHHSCNKIAQQMGGYALDMYCFGIYPCMSVLLITLNIPLRITEIPSFWLPECFTLYLFMDRADSRPYQENFSYWIITSLFHFTYVVFLWWNSFDYKATYGSQAAIKKYQETISVDIVFKLHHDSHDQTPIWWQFQHICCSSLKFCMQLWISSTQPLWTFPLLLMIRVFRLFLSQNLNRCDLSPLEG